MTTSISTFNHGQKIQLPHVCTSKPTSGENSVSARFASPARPRRSSALWSYDSLQAFEQFGWNHLIILDNWLPLFFSLKVRAGIEVVWSAPSRGIGGVVFWRSTIHVAVASETPNDWWTGCLNAHRRVNQPRESWLQKNKAKKSGLSYRCQEDVWPSWWDCPPHVVITCNSIALPSPLFSSVTRETSHSLHCGQKLLLCESIFLTGLDKQGEATGTLRTPHRSAPHPQLARLNSGRPALDRWFGPRLAHRPASRCTKPGLAVRWRVFPEVRTGLILV